MTPEQFQTTDPLLDAVAEQLGNWIEGNASEEIRQTLAQLSEQLNGLSVTLEMTVVPHDRCPCCWAAWDFKDLHPECSGCGARLGSEVKFLIDSNVCPHCEKGTVTPADPKCSDCDFEMNPEHVAWG